MGKGNLAGDEHGAAANKRSETGAVMRCAIGASRDDICTESVQRVELGDSNLFI